MALIRANLSPVEQVRDTGRPGLRIVVGLIYDTARYCVEVEMTPQEALTAMDMSCGDGLDCTPTINGATFDFDGRRLDSFAKWTIPAGAADYHIEGWRSTTGAGRRHSNAIHKPRAA